MCMEHFFQFSVKNVTPAFVHPKQQEETTLDVYICRHQKGNLMLKNTIALIDTLNAVLLKGYFIVE